MKPHRCVTLVHEWLITMGGAERVFLQWLRHLPHREAWALFKEPGPQTAPFDPFPIRTTFFQQFPALRRAYRYALLLMPAAYRRVKIQSDLLLTNSHAFAKTVPKRDAYHICYCYTPVRYLWVLRDAYLQTLRPPLRPAASALLRLLRRADLAAARRVDRFIAISHTVAKRIERIYGRRATVVTPPVDTDFFTPNASVPREDFYLVVSRLVPYKNVELALHAFAGSKSRLYVVGGGPLLKHLQAAAPPNVRLLGYLPEHELRDLYRRCRALIFTSHEDLGLTPLEAQACGTPVVALHRGGARETIRPQETGLFFFEPTAEALRQALEGFEHASFSPDACRRNALRFCAHRFREAMRRLLRDPLDDQAKEG